jgi:hypothetical protein
MLLVRTGALRVRAAALRAEAAQDGRVMRPPAASSPADR